MPLGIERINARRKQPNDRVNFIKPLPGSDEAQSLDFLERVAAICNPIMKINHLAIMSLEEYECNPEFLGRNFNAGEVIQLVLKAPSGRWLPFRFVQMVMMHELAHCKQMNHSRAFWKVKNAYSDELRKLWERGYAGEGLWSRGISLLTGQYEDHGLADNEILPKHLCGGTYRSSGKRKRKTKPKLSYKEQKERRIAKKFGTNGVSLGADDDVKAVLEKGKKPTGKPRVAGSNRGRELRAAAALARFEIKKEEPQVVKEEDGYQSSGSETESDYYEDNPDIKEEPDEAIDINGKKMHDSKGRGLVRVCDDEENDDPNAQNEMSELRSLETLNKLSSSDRLPKKGETSAKARPENLHVPADGCKSVSQAGSNASLSKISRPNPVKKSMACPVCSMENQSISPTCCVCASVLDIEKVPSTWKCKRDICRDSRYINAGDYGVCGVCGSAPKGT
jgi:hypothetical protein